MSHHVHGLSWDYFVSCFISGFRDPVKFEVMAKNSTTVVEVMRLAKLDEDKTSAIRRSSKSSSSRVFLTSQGSSSMGSGAFSKPSTANSPLVAASLIKKLTHQEIRKCERRGCALVAMRNKLLTTNVRTKSRLVGDCT